MLTAVSSVAGTGANVDIRGPLALESDLLIIVWFDVEVSDVYDWSEYHPMVWRLARTLLVRFPCLALFGVLAHQLPTAPVVSTSKMSNLPNFLH